MTRRLVIDLDQWGCLGLVIAIMVFWCAVVFTAWLAIR